MKKWLLACLFPAITQGVEFTGNFTQGGLVIGKVEQGTEVQYLGKTLSLNSQNQFVLGFGRDAELEQTLTLIQADGELQQLPINISKREYRIQRVSGIAKKIMQPSEEDLIRIKNEGAKVYMAREKQSQQPFAFERPIWPSVGPISGVYGSQRFYNGEAGRPHFGVDVAMPKGTQVVAPLTGVVTLAESDLFYSGGTIIIDHGFGINTSYLHLSKVTVSVGDTVNQGDKVGEIGSTGRSTGPHLDWRLNWGQVRLDPQLWAPPMK